MNSILARKLLARPLVRRVSLAASAACVTTALLAVSSLARAADSTASSAASATDAAPPPEGPRGFSVIGQLSYAPNNDAYGDGAGLRLGYALPIDSALALDLGLSALTYAGSNNVAPGTPATSPNPPSATSIGSISAFLYGADLGLHLRSGIVSLKPHVSAGFGWLTGRACLGNACSTVANDQHVFVAPGAALQVTAARHYIVGVDFRYLVMSANGASMNAPAYALFGGYQF